MPPKPKSKVVQACKAMKDLGYSEKTVRPVVMELLKLYEDNWMLIEEDSYRVLVEALLDSEEWKAHGNEFKQPNTWSQDDYEENGPLGKKPRLSSPSIRKYGYEVENQTAGKKDKERKPSHVPKFYHRRKNTISSPQPRIVVKQETEYKLISDDENDESNSLVHFVDTGNPYKLLSGELPCFEVPLAVLPPDSPDTDSPVLLLQKSSYPEVIDLDSEDDAEDISHDLVPKDSDLEANYSEPMNYEHPQSEKIEHDNCDSLKLDIVSSSRGEAKISLMVNAPLGSEFRVPSLEAVLKQVEERCLKSYIIPHSGFSLLRLMKEVCDCFLAEGTSCVNTETLGPADEILFLEVSKDSGSEMGQSEVSNNQLSLSSEPIVSKDLVKVRDVFEVSPQIPRFSGLVPLDLSRAMIYLNLDVSGSVKIDQDIKELTTGAHSSSELVIFQEKRPHLYINDITKGHEDFEISLINEVSEGQGPAFSYISKNVAYNNAHVAFPLARISKQDCCSNCSGDCLSIEIPCACAGKTGCKFTYTPNGLVKEDFLNDFVPKSQSMPQHDLFYCRDCPMAQFNNGNSIGKCKGHVNRRFIKECWYKCGCGMNCGNRVVQRGITAKLQVFMTPEGKGWGLRTLEDVPKGAFICEYVGEVVTIRELFERNIQKSGGSQTYTVLLDADWSSKEVLKDNDALCLDATVYGNIARFINHRCSDANLVGIPVEVETPDRHYYHLAFFTTREVNAFEEITWDYGVGFDDSRQPVKAFQCKCGSKFCRDSGSVKE
ncbi:hypothetical protein OROHE_016629 [Orobanche hederae]